MSKLNGTMPKILVTDADRGAAIAIIRSLGRKGYRVVVADSNQKSLGFRSRYAHERVVYPAPENTPQKFCEYILKIVESKGIDLIIPVTDFAVKPLTLSRDSLEKKTILAIPENGKLEAVMDKDKTVQIAKKLGVPVPKTYTVKSSSEALEKAEKLGRPVVLKPKISRLLREGEKIEKLYVTYAESAEELQESMKSLQGRCSVLLQNYIDGIGYGVELLLNNGQPIAAFKHKRIRELPITGGPSAFRESVRLDRELYDYSLRILKELRWTGLAMVEFKVGNSGAKLMEINGRVWGSLPLAVACGVDFPAMLAELYLNGADSIKPNLDSNYIIGLRCRDLGKDLKWIASVLMCRQKYSFLEMPGRKQAILAFLSIFNPKYKFDLLSLDDPLPGLLELPYIYNKIRKKMQRSGGDSRLLHGVQAK